MISVFTKLWDQLLCRGKLAPIATCVPPHHGLPLAPGRLPGSSAGRGALTTRGPTPGGLSAGLDPQVKGLVVRGPCGRLPVTEPTRWLSGGPGARGPRWLLLGIPWAVGMLGVQGARIWGAEAQGQGTKAAGVLGMQGARIWVTGG